MSFIGGGVLLLSAFYSKDKVLFHPRYYQSCPNDSAFPQNCHIQVIVHSSYGCFGTFVNAAKVEIFLIVIIVRKLYYNGFRHVNIFIKYFLVTIFSI